MTFTVDDETPPPVALKNRIEALEVGQSLLATDRNVGSIRSTVSRVKGERSGRRFITKLTPEGLRVWRLS